jgi:RNA polymerase sigma-70 factor (ECF subfamily)
MAKCATSFENSNKSQILLEKAATTVASDTWMSYVFEERPPSAIRYLKGCETRLAPPIPERLFTLPTIWGGHRARVTKKETPVQAPSLTDEEALMRLKAQDRGALEFLFERYSRLILTIAFRILRDYGEAEEMVQTVFIYLYQKADLYQADKGTARSWIVQVAYHRALDRRAYLTNRQFYLGTDLQVPPDTLSAVADVERDVVSKLNTEQLLAALRELPERQYLTLRLFFFEGLELREISERTGDSMVKVRHNYYRGLDKLRKSTIVRSFRGDRP